MEPVSLILGIVIGVILTLAFVVLLGRAIAKRQQRQVEAALGTVFGKEGFSLDDLGAVFPLPTEPLVFPEPDEPVELPRLKRPVRDTPQA